MYYSQDGGCRNQKSLCRSRMPYIACDHRLKQALYNRSGRVDEHTGQLTRDKDICDQLQVMVPVGWIMEDQYSPYGVRLAANALIPNGAGSSTVHWDVCTEPACRSGVKCVTLPSKGSCASCLFLNLRKSQVARFSTYCSSTKQTSIFNFCRQIPPSGLV
jgi:hypothetical protein